MTALDVEFARLIETKRANRANEGLKGEELSLSGRALDETIRHNIAYESNEAGKLAETQRSNLVREAETMRSNLQKELQARNELEEKRRATNLKAINDYTSNVVKSVDAIIPF